MSAVLRPDIIHANFVATEFVNRKLDYTFTHTEEVWLRKFFSNTDSNIFAFHQSVPDVIISYAIARYSRIKNPRGLRGIMLEDVIPYWIASSMSEYEDMTLEDIQKELKDEGVKSVEDVHRLPGLSSYHHSNIWRAFGDPVRLAELSRADKLKKLFNNYVDGYGHNSIVRTGKVVLCLENVSIMVAKVLEWCRFGAPIELSTRFVDFSEKKFYPIHEELGVSPAIHEYIKNHIENMFDAYGYLMEDPKDGFGKYLENRWADKIPKEINLKSAILGEVCDVLGNLLPCATLTSLGLSVSGEGLPNVLEHLLLEDSAECSAVRSKIIEEVEKIGAGSYLRHLDEPTESRKSDWLYLSHIQEPAVYFSAESNRRAEKKLLNQFQTVGKGFELIQDFKFIAESVAINRKPKDKLPHQFESVNVLYRDLISFRSFRDLQRHTLSTTSRSLVTPLLGFYKYPKPAPRVLREYFDAVQEADLKIWSRLREENCEAKDLQYVLAMGHNVVFEMSHNLRQHELVTKTRTKWDVNDEVRNWILKFEHKVRRQYPWYTQLSRADMTPHYLFARGTDDKKGIKMPKLSNNGGLYE